MPVAAICGLAAEARIARRAGLVAVATGGDAARTTAAVERQLIDGAAIVSFGIAGGLDPSLASGTLLLPRGVREAEGARIAVDADWHGRVRAALARLSLPPHEGDLIGAAQAVTTVTEKAALFRRTGAAAVDLESTVVARAAARAKRPFLVLRAVADPAARDLPPAAAIALGEHGGPALGPILLSVLGQPGQIAGLLKLARDTRQALATLAHAVHVLHM
jgi:adenosylhomocysteine nucleosidase